MLRWTLARSSASCVHSISQFRRMSHCDATEKPFSCSLRRNHCRFNHFTHDMDYPLKQFHHFYTTEIQNRPATFPHGCFPFNVTTVLKHIQQLKHISVAKSGSGRPKTKAVYGLIEDINVKFSPTNLDETQPLVKI